VPAGGQVTFDNKVYNVFLDPAGKEQRSYVGDLRDVRTFKVVLLSSRRLFIQQHAQMAPHAVLT
jgi:hypothetical protein